MGEVNQKTGWRQKAKGEFIRYWLNVFYLAIVFGLFAWYRRLILAHYEIKYLEYGAAIVEAMVLGKVIMLGDMLGLSRRMFRNRPLILPTLYKAVVFSFFVAIFAIVEGTVSGWFKGRGWAGWFDEMRDGGKYEFLARCVMLFVVFIPYFGFKELGNIFGEGKLGKLFFRSHQALVDEGGK
jgi:hypothetical protein